MQECLKLIVDKLMANREGRNITTNTGIVEHWVIYVMLSATDGEEHSCLQMKYGHNCGSCGGHQSECNCLRAIDPETVANTKYSVRENTERARQEGKYGPDEVWQWKLQGAPGPLTVFTLEGNVVVVRAAPQMKARVQRAARYMGVHVWTNPLLYCEGTYCVFANGVCNLH